MKPENAKSLKELLSFLLMLVFIGVFILGLLFTSVIVVRKAWNFTFDPCERLEVKTNVHVPCECRKEEK